MFRSKVIITLIVALLSTYSVFSQSFTYSGPSEVAINYGSTTATATFYFTYSNLDAAHHVAYPMLNIKVDGIRITNYDLCNNPQTPSSYGISLTPGSHTITFTLMSVDWYSLNCYQPTFWQVNEVTVNCKFNISIENIFGGGSIYGLFEYDGSKNVKQIFKGSNGQESWSFVQQIDGRIFFGIGTTINKYINGEFKPFLKINDINFWTGFYGRTEKDIFLMMAYGIAHYNGTNIEYLYKNPTKIHILDAVIFRKEVFFLAVDPTIGGNLIIRGKLN